MKILNLYAGLGGNRKLWKDCQVTAVEIEPTIARFYMDHFPDDEIIIGDAHEYLLNNYKKYDFIWSSINCPSHSRARFWASKGGRYEPVFPDLKLYEEILFLSKYYDGKYVVENVVPYYLPLIKPTIKIERHLFLTNINITDFSLNKNNVSDGNIAMWQEQFGFDITGYDFSIRKDKLLRNCVHPDLGLHIMNCAKINS